eukprot:Em0014g408a
MVDEFKALNALPVEIDFKGNGGDIVAIEAKYHIECLVKYKNSYRSAQRAAVSQYSKIDENRCLQALVFAEVVAYIENEVENGTNIFKLSELHMIYENRLQSVGITITVNKTRFKSQLTAHFSDSCQETSDGRNTLLVFNDGFQKLLKDAMANRDIESEAISMAKLVKTIRMDMLDWAEYEFNGKFPPGCQEISVPASLKALVAMLLNGCNETKKLGYLSHVLLLRTYFASRQPETTDPAALISLLPLFNEKAATFAMVKHGMDIQRQITAHLNPGQIPVTAFDQPLFALAKYVQWQFPDIYGEQHYVVMFGDRARDVLKDHLMGELDYYLLPKPAWEKLLSWYGLSEGSQPIERKVVEYGLYMNHCKVEVYLMDFKLCQQSQLNETISRQFSRATTVAQLEAAMRELFNVPKETVCRVWYKYNSSLYEELSMPEQTLQDAGLYAGQTLVLEKKNADGTWPRSAQSCTYRTPVPTRPLYLPDLCTHQTPVPTRPLYPPDPCSYQTPVPTRPLYLPDPCTYQTPVPTRPLYLPDPCTYQTPVPTRPLYLPDPCTYQTPVPTRLLYLPDPCTYQTPVPDPCTYQTPDWRRRRRRREEEEEEEDNMEEEEKEEEEEEEEERI